MTSTTSTQFAIMRYPFIDAPSMHTSPSAPSVPLFFFSTKDDAIAALRHFHASTWTPRGFEKNYKTNNSIEFVKWYRMDGDGEVRCRGELWFVAEWDVEREKMAALERGGRESVTEYLSRYI
jgi:hypothetical protein